MMETLWVKAVLVWLVIAAAETGHGILRVRLLNRHLGDRRARQWTVVSGSLLILFIAWCFSTWLNVQSAREAFLVGGIWVLLMLAYDLGLGRWVFHMSWTRLLADLDPRKGGMLGLGMLVLLFAPWLTAHLRDLL